jgi:hypothetical protein
MATWWPWPKLQLRMTSELLFSLSTHSCPTLLCVMIYVIFANKQTNPSAVLTFTNSRYLLSSLQSRSTYPAFNVPKHGLFVANPSSGARVAMSEKWLGYGNNTWGILFWYPAGLHYSFYKAFWTAGAPKNPSSMVAEGSFTDLKRPGFAALQSHPVRPELRTRTRMSIPQPALNSTGMYLY